MTKSIGILSLLLLFQQVKQVSFAQKPRDTKMAADRFMQVCNHYKQVPLQVRFQIKNKALFIEDPADTMGITAEFYIQPNGTYIKYGEIEQLVNDSVLLLVSHQAKRIIIYPNSRSVKDQMKKYLTLMANDSSVEMIQKNYGVSYLPSAANNEAIQLTRKTNLLSSEDLPKETIVAEYDKTSLEPDRIIYTKRSLIPFSYLGKDSMEISKQYPGKTVLSNGSGYLVNERVSEYDFMEIAHKTGEALPVQITDRVLLNKEGNYTGAKGFEDYIIRRN